MRKFVLLLAFCFLLTGWTACSKPQPQPSDPVTTVPTTQQTTASATQQTTAVPAGPQPMDLVGSWSFAYTEIEGEQVTEGNAILTVQGETPETLTVTYRDLDFPDEAFTEKALIPVEQPIYPGCGNEQWQMTVEHTGAIGGTRYALTLLPDGMLLLQFSFTVEDMPMVSYRFFTRE